MSIDITQHGQSRSEEERAESAKKMQAALDGQRPDNSQFPVPHPTGPAAGAGNILHTVKEVCHVTQAEQVNKLMNNGWHLIAVGDGVERTGEHEFSPYFRYSMGRVR